MRRRDRVQARLRFFADRGELDVIPTRWQLRVGWLAGLPVYLSESERERQASRRTWLSQVPIRAPLQALYSPRHLLLASGLALSARDVVRHLLCVYHEDAFLGYDLQLLMSVPGGLPLLAAEAQRVVDGRSRLAPVLRRVVGGNDYHARLVACAEAAQQGRLPDPLDLDPRFATLVGFARFCAGFPDWPDRSFYGFDISGGLR